MVCHGPVEVPAWTGLGSGVERRDVLELLVWAHDITVSTDECIFEGRLRF